MRCYRNRTELRMWLKYYRPNRSTMKKIRLFIGHCSICSITSTPVDFDLCVVGRRCEKSPLFEDRAGVIYVTDCYTEAGTGTDLVYKAQIIAQMYILRLLMSAGLRIHSLASDDKADVADVLDETNSLIDKINALTCGNSAERSIRDSISEALRRTERRQGARKAGLSCGIPTGISDLDRLTAAGKARS